MRMVLLFGLLAACTPPEENCVLRSSAGLTDGQAAWRVDAGEIIVSSTSECPACIRDRTVPAGPPASAAVGYCAAPCESRCRAGGPCEFSCPAGTHCAEVGELRLCLHGP